jgi:hypothetical protein
LIKGFSFPRDELSAVPPDQYADRFVRFIRINVRTKDESQVQPTRENLSQTAILEESPMASRETSRPLSNSNSVDLGRTVLVAGEQALPAIMVQHPSPELKEGESFENELLRNGTKEGLVNGCGDDHFVDRTIGKGLVDGDVRSEIDS